MGRARMASPMELVLKAPVLMMLGAPSFMGERLVFLKVVGNHRKEKRMITIILLCCVIAPFVDC